MDLLILRFMHYKNIPKDMFTRIVITCMIATWAQLLTRLMTSRADPRFVVYSQPPTCSATTTNLLNRWVIQCDLMWSDPIRSVAYRSRWNVDLFLLFLRFRFESAKLLQFWRRKPWNRVFSISITNGLFAVFGGGPFSFCWRVIFKEILVQDHFYRKPEVK